MAKWSAVKGNWTPAAIADTTNLTAAGFVAIQGAALQMNKFIEVSGTGLAGASAPQQLLFARDSTVFSGATSNAVKLTPLDIFTANLAAMPLAQDVGSTTLPQRSVGYLLTPTFNAFGGIYRWVASPGEEITTFGAAAFVSGSNSVGGEVSLSHASTGTPGLMNSHIIFEPS